MYLRCFLFQMREGFMNFILEWVSFRLALDCIFLGSYWKAKRAWQRPQPLVEHGPRGPWDRSTLQSATGLTHRSQGGAAWGSASKAPKETWVASFLYGNWNIDSIIYSPTMAKEKVVQLCNPVNTLPWITMASHSSDPWLGSPEIRHVPIESIFF